MAVLKGPDNFLFVYGSLAPGQSNEHILKSLSGTWRKGTVRGFLHQGGWGAATGYLGIELDPKGDDIPGQVFSSKGLENFWETLDSFEGEEYQRVITTVDLPNGKQVKAYIYELKNP